MSGAPGLSFRQVAPPYDGDPSACMRQLDGLPWAAGVAFTLHGIKMGIRVSSATMLERIEATLPAGAQPVNGPDVDFLYSVTMDGGGGTPPAYTSYADAVPIARTVDFASAIRAVNEDLARLAGHASRGRLIVRAGAVGWEGMAILVLGPRSSGRSTLVAGLLWAGAEYYGDELAVLDVKGRVHPFVRPLSLRCGVGAGPVQLADLGAAAGSGPIPIGAVVATVFRPGAAWRPKGLKLTDAVELLVANTLTGKRAPDSVRPAFDKILGGTRRFSGERGEAGEVIFRILSGLGTLLAGGEHEAG